MAADAPRVSHFVDQPTAWERISRCLFVRGWCFDQQGGTIRGVRLRAGDLIFSGVVGLPRPDVRAALPQAPDDNTGFEIRGKLPPGRVTLALEAQTSEGNWHELVTHRVTVRLQILPLWLGGGDWNELMCFQMPASMVHPPRPVKSEKFPAPSSHPRPKFSIVTPSYQQARFLEETMRSVLEQPGVECEYVIQDGGSTDGSVEIIQRLAGAFASQIPDLKSQNPPAAGPVSQISRRRSQISALSSQLSTSRPRLASWATEPDHGQTDAIARAFAKTSGAPDDVMAWINSDDFYLPGALPFVADYFARHPEVDVLYGHRIMVDEESREIARRFLPKHDDAVLQLFDFVPQETMFWRRRIWDKVGGLDASFKFAMDWDLLLRFRAAGAKIVRVPWFLACFRVHPAQKTSAAMHDVGQREIDLLRARANGREIPPAELEQHPRLLGYLRRSAFIQFLWKLGLRAP